MRKFSRVTLRLRALQLGISIEQMDFVTCGQVLDFTAEAHNDKQQWPVKGSGAMLRQMFM